MDFSESILKEWSNLVMDKYIDKETGLYNRMYINNKLPKEYIKSQVKNRNSYLVAVNIDQLDANVLDKDTINEMVKNFTNKVKNSLDGKNTWIARYNADKLILVVNEETDTSIFYTIEKTRQIVSEETEMKLTGTFGVTRLDSVHTDEEIRNADKKLARAKELGRNRVVWN